MSRQGSLSIERMCDLAQVSRAGFYRSLQADRPANQTDEPGCVARAQKIIRPIHFYLLTV
jgi:hypothetical protein